MCGRGCSCENGVGQNGVYECTHAPVTVCYKSECQAAKCGAEKRDRSKPAGLRSAEVKLLLDGRQRKCVEHDVHTIKPPTQERSPKHLSLRCGGVSIPAQ